MVPASMVLRNALKFWRQRRHRQCFFFHGTPFDWTLAMVQVPPSLLPHLGHGMDFRRQIRAIVA
jgi:hypothetical protein